MRAYAQSIAWNLGLANGIFGGYGACKRQKEDGEALFDNQMDLGDHAIVLPARSIDGQSRYPRWLVLSKQIQEIARLVRVPNTLGHLLASWPAPGIQRDGVVCLIVVVESVGPELVIAPQILVVEADNDREFGAQESSTGETLIVQPDVC